MSDMLVKLYELPELAPALEPLHEAGIVLRRAFPPEKHKVSEWVGRVFNPHWVSECEVAIAGDPSKCLIATMADPEDAEGKKQIMIGFACYDTTAKAFFGPTGVDPDVRGKGVGKALLLAALHELRNQGYAYGIIGSAGPTEFYAKTVGATEIPGSTPGIYKGMLR